MKAPQSIKIGQTFQVVLQEAGIRLDKFIASKIVTKSRSQIQHLILNASVILNCNIEKNCSKRLQNKDVILLFCIKKKNVIKSFDFPLDIIYEDKDLILINKPSNITTHSGANILYRTLSNALEYYCKKLSFVSGPNRRGVVHRLDKDTSGLMLIAKNNSTHFYLCNQILKKQIKRRYLLILYKAPNPVMGKIITNIAPSKNNPATMRISCTELGKNAITNYRVINGYKNSSFSLVECELETGRTHQIRLHMQYKNSPIVGDKKYKACSNFNINFSSYGLIPKIININRQALHAYRISFIHPKLVKKLEFKLPVAYCMANVLNLSKI